jgi:transcription elongation factor GreA
VVSEGSFLSRKGYEDLRNELDHLRAMKRELSEEIGRAAAMGDLSENFEYTAAKDKQAEVLRRISAMESKLKSAKIIEEAGIPADKAYIGATVVLKDLESNETVNYTLVDSAEADPMNGKISVHTPVAQALLGHQVGDIVEIKTPGGGQLKYKVTDISR